LVYVSLALRRRFATRTTTTSGVPRG